jgi:hypothetical protein
MRTSALSVTFDRMSEVLSAARRADGSLGWTRGAPPEPEPTALLALSLGDEAASEWLLAHQADDGAVVLETGEVRNTGAAALNALALPTETAQIAALDFAVSALATFVEGSSDPGDPEGWGWVPDTFAWVEPTSRVLLATRILRPSDAGTINDALTILRGREISTGGWNYGNSSVRGTDLKPYTQTTAIACIAMQGLAEPALDRGLALLETLGPRERGGMSLAMSALALRLNGREQTAAFGAILRALLAQYEKTAFLGSLGAVAWAAMATSTTPALEVSR